MMPLRFLRRLLGLTNRGPEVVPESSGPRLDSAEDVRGYVENELARTIRNHPGLTLARGERWQGTSRSPDLTWRIEGPPDPWAVDYVIEARLADDEFLIWFGYSSAGPMQTYHLVRPAVHISMKELAFSNSAYQYGQTTNEFTLGAILEIMLAPQGHRAILCFPMNNYALT